MEQTGSLFDSVMVPESSKLKAKSVPNYDMNSISNVEWSAHLQGICSTIKHIFLQGRGAGQYAVMRPDSFFKSSVQ